MPPRRPAKDAGSKARAAAPAALDAGPVRDVGRVVRGHEKRGPLGARPRNHAGRLGRAPDADGVRPPAGKQVPMNVANRFAPPGVLQPSVVMLDAKHAPYPRRGVAIENICGIFATYVEVGMLRGLIVDTITPFGVQHMLFHAEGNVVVDQGRGFFKACRSAAGIEELSRCLYLETPRNRVHMLVLTARLGKRVQVESAGYLERALAPHRGLFRITPPMDEVNHMRLEVQTFAGPFEIDRSIRPLSNDWTVTGRGSLTARFTWPKDETLNWGADVERMVIEYSQRVVALLESCC